MFLHRIAFSVLLLNFCSSSVVSARKNEEQFIKNNQEFDVDLQGFTFTDASFGNADTPLFQRLAKLPWPMDADLKSKFIAHEKKFRSDWNAPDSLLELENNTPQVVYVDFNDIEGTYIVRTIIGDDEQGPTLGPYPKYEFTPEEQSLILGRLRDDYEPFDIEFVDQVPDAGSFSTLFLNEFDDNIVVFISSETGRITGIQTLLGFAEGIDFLNLIDDDNAFVDPNVLDALVQLDPSGALLTEVTTVPVVDGDVQQTLSTSVINLSANVGAHEVGHILGLRHYNAFGAPGDGLPNTGVPGRESFTPPYDGPEDAKESNLHTMATPGSVGQPLSDQFSQDTFLSERSSIKLSLAFGSGTVILEEEAKEESQEMGGIDIPQLTIPNTILEGENSGPGTLDTRTMVIVGRIDDSTERDTYRFHLQKGQILNAEVISLADRNNIDPFDPFVELILEDDNSSVDPSEEAGEEGVDPGDGSNDVKRNLGGNNDIEVATNLDEFESTDSILIDEEVPKSGTFKLVVGAEDHSDPGNFGNYKLLVYIVERPLTQGPESGGILGGKDHEEVDQTGVDSVGSDRPDGLEKGKRPKRQKAKKGEKPVRFLRA